MRQMDGRKISGKENFGCSAHDGDDEDGNEISFPIRRVLREEKGEMLPCDVSNRVSALKAQNAINFDILRRGFYEAWEKGKLEIC